METGTSRPPFGPSSAMIVRALSASHSPRFVCLGLEGLSLPHCWQGKWCLFSNADYWTSQSETKKARTVVASRRPRSWLSTARDHVPSTVPETFLRIRGTPTGTCDFGQPRYDRFCRRIQEKNCAKSKKWRGPSKGSLQTLNVGARLRGASTFRQHRNLQSRCRHPAGDCRQWRRGVARAAPARAPTGAAPHALRPRRAR